MERQRKTRTGGVEKAHKKPGRKSRLTRQQKVLVTVAAVLAVALVLVVAYQALFVRPELGKNPDDPDAETVDYGEGVRPKGDGARKSKDYYTVLILGRDTGGGGNTDTMLLASYDVTNQRASVMSIPRDTMVNVPWDLKKINSVYNYNGGGDKGIKALYKEISQLVGFEPDYQVIVEWEAVGAIVEAMGGVYFDVPRDMKYNDPLQDLYIDQKAGYRLLSGDDAMQVIRYRHDNRKNGKTLGYADGDLGRIKTQQAFLKAVVEQMLQVKNVANINKFAKVFEENVETDLSFQNILWFGKQAVLGGLSVDHVEFVTMPNQNSPCYSRSIGNIQSYVTPIASELLELVNTKLSPFVEPSRRSDLDIMSVNSDGSVSSTTGYVEDKKAATAPYIPPHTPVAPPDEDPVISGEIPPEGGEITPPAEGTVPGDGTVTPPGEGTTTPPTGGTTTPPTGDTTTPPTGGTTTPPAGGTTTPPAGGTTTPPTGGTTTPPTGGTTTPPTGGTTTPPTGGTTTPPTGGTTTPPAGDTTPPPPTAQDPAPEGT
ncbi:MAG: LCP family protein [Oscillibacter sp.]